jgi:threonine synthase
VAGLRRLLDEGKVSRRERVVCVCTGHVLKDPDAVMAQCGRPIATEATAEAVRKAISQGPMPSL